MEKSKNKILYDENAKKFLSQKIILAHILVATVEEFKGMKPETAMQYIESHPAVSTERVDPEGTEIKDFLEDDKSTMITGMNTEDLSEIDETIFYDIKFYAYAPSTKERIKLIIGIEAQNKFDPGYDIVTRSVYYGARMLSSQKGTEFVKSDYDKIKKVYSIWILTRCPLDIRNTITEFSIKQNNIVGNAVFNNRYDLLNIIFVGLSAEVINESDEHRLHRLLETFFSPDLTKDEKKNIIENEYNIAYSEDIEGSVNVMCNVSDAIYEDGLKQGLEQGLEQGQNLLADAIKKIKANNCLTAKDLVEAGFSKETADLAVELAK